MEGVKAISEGKVLVVTLHLTAHHLILSQPLPTPPETDTSKNAPKTRESWLAYPVIAFCTFRPTLQGSGNDSLIRIRCRDFRFLAFSFTDDKQARDVFESIKGATCKLGKVENLYAFSYRPPLQEKEINGWEVYNAKAEWRRQGISEKGVDRGWRISRINADYAFSATYPALLVVPSNISDNTLNYAGRFRAKDRIPVLTYLHSVNNCSITRSAQPMAGLRGNRSIQDEKLVSASFQAAARFSERENVSAPLSRTGSQSDLAETYSGEDNVGVKESSEDAVIAAASEDGLEKPQVYGAQQQNIIVDARPTVNAMANAAMGKGTENMDNYKFATKVYLGVDNIHVMRESLAKVIDAIKDADISPLPPNRELLAKSGWLKHIAALLEGASLIARQVAVLLSHVLIHCSDGWDRTGQLSSLAQLLLDPYYRTIDGFIVLIEKDWLAFGHMFAERAGSLASEKWFNIQTDALAGGKIQPGTDGEVQPDAFGNALLSAKRFFKKSNSAQASPLGSDGEKTSFEDSPRGSRSSYDKGAVEHDHIKLKDVSPIFHQFLDCTYQLLRQFPDRFEFNERFLRRLFYHLYSCQYGTFLYNSEKARSDAKVHERTSSVWAYFLARRTEFTNPTYDGGEIDDNIPGKERLLVPKADKVRWWHELFNRTEEDMHGPSNEATEKYLGAEIADGSNVLTGVEMATTPTSASTSSRKVSAASSFSGLRDQIAAFSLRKNGTTSEVKSPPPVTQELEVEMQ